MALENFDFPYHKVSHTYPERTARIKLGNDWDYVTKPTTPISRMFTLYFPVMKYFESPDTLNFLDRRYSADHLDSFYQRHEMWSEFLYPHPKFGNMVVRFDSPLALPKGITSGEGAIEAFQVKLKEVPF